MIDVKKLYFSYTDKPFVENVSFHVGRGEIFGFLGPSGAGKSTIQKVLTGLNTRYKGSVKVAGTEIREHTNRFYENIGVDFEFSTCYEKFTARQNLAYFASLYEKQPRSIDELLHMVGLENDGDKQKCIMEAKRVCKDGGKIFFAFISNDFVFLTEFEYDVNYFSNGDYDKETFRLNNFPFVFQTVGAARKLLADGGVNVLHEVASDGASELLAAGINEMSEEDYAQYLRYHFYICEKPELLGMTNHLLFVGEKK